MIEIETLNRAIDTVARIGVLFFMVTIIASMAIGFVWMACGVRDELRREREERDGR